jgi:hypothetical protein
LLPLLFGFGNNPMDQLVAFKLWLQSHQYRDSTIRNYLVDIRKYLTSKITDPSLYLISVQSDPNYPRYLASLKKYAEFSRDQGSSLQIKVSSVTPSSPTLKSLVSLYQKHLIRRNTPESTQRNYINDLNQYINWLETTSIDSQQ